MATFGGGGGEIILAAKVQKKSALKLKKDRTAQDVPAMKKPNGVEQFLNPIHILIETYMRRCTFSIKNIIDLPYIDPG